MPSMGMTFLIWAYLHMEAQKALKYYLDLFESFLTMMVLTEPKLRIQTYMKNHAKYYIRALISLKLRSCDDTFQPTFSIIRVVIKLLKNDLLKIFWAWPFVIDKLIHTNRGNDADSDLLMISHDMFDTTSVHAYILEDAKPFVLLYLLSRNIHLQEVSTYFNL